MGISSKPEVSKPGHKPRSPNYPAVGLEEAVKRVKRLIEADGRAGAPPEAAAKHVGFSGLNGSAIVLLSALKKFGLVAESNGRLVPTQLAVDVINFPEGHERRTLALQKAALNPTIYRLIVDQFKIHGELPSDTSLRPELIADRGFTPSKVTQFLNGFRSTLVYAGLLKDGKLQLSTNAGDIAEVDATGDDEVADGRAGGLSVATLQVGAYVQWTNSGSDQFKAPRRVRWVSDDGGWAAVDGSETGLPTSQLTVVGKPMDATMKTPPVPPLESRDRATAEHGRLVREEPADGTWGVVPLRFPLPRGNVIEIRLKSKVTKAEFKKIEKIFELSAMAFIEDEEHEGLPHDDADAHDDKR